MSDQTITATFHCHTLKQKGILSLTARQFDCFSLWIIGIRLKKIARMLSISPRTVEAHLYNIRQKNPAATKDEMIYQLMHMDLYQEIIAYGKQFLMRPKAGKPFYKTISTTH